MGRKETAGRENLSRYVAAADCIWMEKHDGVDLDLANILPREPLTREGSPMARGLRD